MKRTITIAAIGLLGLLAPDRARILEAARRIMAKSVYCAFITLGEDGQPQARTVQPFAPDAAMVVWIGTNPLTRKIAQIRKDAWSGLYKDKFRGDDYTLIRVAPVRLEIVSYQDGIVGDPKTLRPTSIEFK